MDLLGLVVEDRRLDRPVEELGRMAGGSVTGGFQTASRRRLAGDPSRSIRRTDSKPVSRSASSTGLAIVAEARRKRGSVP
ncbi:MAG: hypothetical protein LC720_01185 [Actinobacteria bacterium]|nr:hypothetical protein [Actinomycetota bacterium]